MIKSLSVLKILNGVVEITMFMAYRIRIYDLIDFREYETITFFKINVYLYKLFTRIFRFNIIIDPIYVEYGMHIIEMNQDKMQIEGLYYENFCIGMLIGFSIGILFTMLLMLSMMHLLN